jgi:hypothetical protein
MGAIKSASIAWTQTKLAALPFNDGGAFLF